MNLVVCADDFGLNQFVDQGIMALVAGGRVTAASCLVDGPTAEANARRLAALDADIGLHLNFTEPLPGARLAIPLWRLTALAYSRRLDESAIAIEIRRQLDRFEELFGAAPHYVDGHQHVHQLPEIRDALLEELMRRYPAPLPWLRATTGPRGSMVPFALKATVIELLGARALAARARRSGFAMNTNLLGVYDFRGTASRYGQWLDQWASLAKDGSLLMCHPATGGAASDDVIGYQRVIEYEVLAGPEFLSKLERHKLKPRRMSRYLPCK